MSKKAIKEDFFTKPLEPVEQVRLSGSKCSDCGEVFLGKRIGCENCGCQDLETVTLSDHGRLYSYTVLYAPLNESYKGPNNPFVPIGIGLVELPEGCRIIAPLTVNDPEKLKVEMQVKLVIDTLYTDENGDEILAFKYDAA